MNLPNRLTLLRLGLVPAFMVFMFVDHLSTRILALIIFIIASITDWIDGKVARETGTVTVIGTFLDPLVDKMLICTALVGFVELHELHIPAWMVVLIIGREFLITGLRSLAAKRGIVIAAEKGGKFKTASQITSIILILMILIFHSLLEFQPNAAWVLSFHSSSFGHSFTRILDHLPYGLVLLTTALTLFSGYLYIRKYRDLLNREFRMNAG